MLFITLIWNNFSVQKYTGHNFNGHTNRVNTYTVQINTNPSSTGHNTACQALMYIFLGFLNLQDIILVDTPLLEKNLLYITIISMCSVHTNYVNNSTGDYYTGQNSILHTCSLYINTVNKYTAQNST